MNFLNFQFIQDLIGVNFKDLKYDGEFWGLNILEEDDLLKRIIRFTMFLVFGVIGYWSIQYLNSSSIFERDIEWLEISSFNDLKQAKNSALETALMLIEEEKFWNGAKSLQYVFSFFG